jgi:hypothetical protein
MQHGLHIGIQREKNQYIMYIKIKGKLTHEDYKIITPMLKNALNGVNEPKIKLLVDAVEFDGWELEAMWDDFKLGLEYNKEFNKIAFVGNKTWQDYAIKVADIFTYGDINYFEDLATAKSWLLD